jgi:hypothetical protein
MENPEKLYKKGIIYKLSGIDENDREYVYIGSSVNYLCNRAAVHKYHYKLYKNGQLKGCSSSSKIYENCKHETIKLEPIETKLNITRTQLRELENNYIVENMNSNTHICVNLNKSFLTEEERKEKLRQFARDYYHGNKEKKQEYYRNNKEHILQKARERYEKNYNNIREYHKKWRENKIAAQMLK